MPKLTLKQANTIIEKALAKARDMKIRPLGVVVLDDSGNIVSAQREDGASMFRLDVAKGKAWAAVAMGASSKALGGGWDARALEDISLSKRSDAQK